MTHRDDDGTPVDHDPTGIRDLLSHLPEPGPMPEDLVARITASLAREAEVGPDAAGLRGQVLPLDTTRRPNRRWQVLGVAAAVIGVLGIGGVVASTMPGGLTAALDLGRGSDSAGSAAGSAADDATQPESASVGDTVIVMTGHPYRSADLGGDAAVLLTGEPEALTPLTAESPGVGTIGTEVGARACADALGVPPDAALVVDIATVDDAPAAVVVVADTSGHTAYAVQRSCSVQAPGVLAGPVPVPAG